MKNLSTVLLISAIGTFLFLISCSSDDSADNDGFLVTISQDNISISEPNGTSRFTLSLDIVNSTGSDVVVNYTTSGTATSGTDYQSLSGSVSIQDGSQEASVNIVVIDDSEDEFDETIIITVLSGNQIRLGPTKSVEFILSDDD